MDSQPMPTAPTGYGSRDRDGGERRAFTQPAWDQARTGTGVGGPMGGRGGSYGIISSTVSIPSCARTNGGADRPRFSEREQLPLPTKPPFTAHLGNLTYDVTSAEIEDFFKDCQVTNVRIVEDKLDHKPKGFGYVEFATLDGLKNALTYSERNFMGRNVKISVAEPRRFLCCVIISANKPAEHSFSEGTRRAESRLLRLVSQRPTSRLATKYSTTIRSRLQPKL